MPVLKNCVVIDDKVYCWDTVRQRYVKAFLEVDEGAPVPEEAQKLIAMKQFNLIERDD